MSAPTHPFGQSRRTVLVTAGAAATAGLASLGGPARAATPAPSSTSAAEGSKTMSMYTTKDGTKIFYKDWGAGPVVTFSHGWPLNADAWDTQALFLVNNGFRVIAHDRRSHGRSDQTSVGNDMDHYADDLAELLDKLDVKGAMMVGHSTGGGEVARYIGRHGTKRVSKAVLIGAVTPMMLATESHPAGAPMSVFDGLRASVAANRSQFYKDLAVPFYGFNKPGATPQQAVIDEFWREGMTGGIVGQYDCVKAFSETDLAPDLAKFNIPTLFLHGDADQIVPIDISAKQAVGLVKGATLKIYEGAPHGMCTTLAEKVNADLLAFARS